MIDYDDRNPLLVRGLRAARSLAELNARIARLAMLLKLSLRSDEEVARIERGELQQHGKPRDRMAERELAELRALLVLRCRIMARMLDRLGYDATQQIVSQAEDHLERIGFAPGADGFHLLPRKAV